MVSRAHLERVSDEGHVVSPQNIERVGPASDNAISEIGISKFPRMTIYCSHHDKSLFKELEDFGTASQSTLRALLHRSRHFELIKKRTFSKVDFEVFGDAVARGVFTVDEGITRRRAWEAGTEICQKSADNADRIILEQSEVVSLHRKIDLPGVVAATGSVSPFFELNGDEIIPLQYGIFPSYKPVTLYVFFGDLTELILVGEASDSPTIKYIDSFSTYPDKQLQAELIAILFWMTEDVFVRPTFFRQLPDFYRSELTYYVFNQLIPYSGSVSQQVSWKGSPTTCR